MVRPAQRTVFVGTYRHAVDEKKRVAIPAKWRAAASGASEFCILRDPKNCLVVVSQSRWEKMLDKASEMPVFGGGEQRDAMEVIASQAHVSSADSQGRINLTEELLQFAGITGEAVLVGAFDCFRIWSPSGWEKKSSGHDLAEAAKQVGL